MSNYEVVIGSDQPDRGEQDEAAVRDSKLTTEPVAPNTYGPKNVPATMNSTVSLITMSLYACGNLLYFEKK